MITYYIISEDRNGKEYNDEVISTIKFDFQIGQYLDPYIFPERWVKDVHVKTENLEK